jgi:hypothetical protein
MTVGEIADELNVPVRWVILTFLHAGAMKTNSSQLTDDEETLIRSESARWGDDGPPSEGFVRGHS